MRKIAIGYLSLRKKQFISNIEITKNFFISLKHYARVKFIPVTFKTIKYSFKNIEQHRLDYLYLDSFNFLLHSFLLREKFGLDLPFIFTIHSVFHWLGKYIRIIPLIRDYDVIIAPCGYAKGSFSRISDKFNIRVIPYFLDTRFVKRNIVNKKRPCKSITFMGRLTEEKGVGTLINCMPEIISKAGNVQLFIIGPLGLDMSGGYPTNRYLKKLKKDIKRLKLTKHVFFKGAKFGAEKYRILSQSDVLVNPTLAFEEAFPIVNIEAMACGLPVVSTDWAGNKELIKNGKNGFLVKVEYNKGKPEIDRKQLTSLIVRVIKGKEPYLRLGKNALKTSENFDYRKLLSRLMASLKKRRERKAKNRWESVQDKSVMDFKHLFNKDFLFFLYLKAHFKIETYGSLYNEMLKACSLNRCYFLDKERLRLKSAKELKLMDKINRDLRGLLLNRAYG